MTRPVTRRMVERLFASRAFLPVYRRAVHAMRRPCGAVIVNFHQFHDGTTGFLQKGPSVHTQVADFDRMLGLLRSRFEIISLTTLVDHLTRREPLPRDSAAVTIDDGYENNLTLGLPILKKHGIPATLFVATGYMGTDTLLPMDRVDFMLRNTTARTLDWPERQLTGVRLETHEDRAAANSTVGKIIKRLPAADMDDAFRQLARSLDVRLESAVSPMLDWNQVRQLSEAGVEIGSHAVTHTCMTRLDTGDAVSELEDSMKHIEIETGHRPRHFAFPNGMPEDFSDALRDEAKRVGYDSVASVERGINVPGRTEPTRLLRVGLVGEPEQTLLYIERLFARQRSGASGVRAL